MLIAEHQNFVAPKVFPQRVDGRLVDTVGQVNADDLSAEHGTGRDDLVRGGLGDGHVPPLCLDPMGLESLAKLTGIVGRAVS